MKSAVKVIYGNPEKEYYVLEVKGASVLLYPIQRDAGHSYSPYWVHASEVREEKKR